MTYDCIVIGLGGMGSSTLYHLARRGVSALGIDQYEPIHDRGSSHGETRVIRKAYFEHPNYVPLLHRAYDLWRALESESGQKLYVENGVLLAGPSDGDAIAGSLRSAAEHDVSVCELEVAEASKRFPLFRFSDHQSIVFEEQAGYLRVESCVQAHLDAAHRAGATTRFGDRVRSCNAKGSSVVVETDSERVESATLVITAGAWSRTLLSDVLPEVRVLRKRQCWHAVDRAHLANLKTLPSFFFETPVGAFYGVPSLQTDSVKLARHTGGTVVADPSTIGQSGPCEERDAIERFTVRHLNGVVGDTLRVSDCLYSMSPDGHFLIDRHPAFRNVVFAAGFSGHGFKFASVLGECLADFATQGRTDFPVEFLSLNRFD